MSQPVRPVSRRAARIVVSVFVAVSLFVAALVGFPQPSLDRVPDPVFVGTSGQAGQEGVGDVAEPDGGEKRPTVSPPDDPDVEQALITRLILGDDAVDVICRLARVPHPVTLEYGFDAQGEVRVRCTTEMPEAEAFCDCLTRELAGAPPQPGLAGRSTRFEVPVRPGWTTLDEVGFQLGEALRWVVPDAWQGDGRPPPGAAAHHTHGSRE